MLHCQGQTLKELDQTTLDTWQAHGPFERWRVKPFLQWCRKNGSCQPLILYTPPARPLTIRKRLHTLGVKPHDYRSAALGHIAQQLPSPVLARLTGLNPLTAVRWNRAVSASQARNLPFTAPKNLASDGGPQVFPGP
jgi:hypothetical protein